MTTTPPRTPDEERLRARFSELKREDERALPDFARMWSRSPGRRAWPPLLAAGTLAAAAAIALWWGIGSSTAPSVAARPPALPPDPAPWGGELAGRVKLDPTPLDFLLDIQPTAPRGVARLGANSNPIHGW